MKLFDRELEFTNEFKRDSTPDKICCIFLILANLHARSDVCDFATCALLLQSDLAVHSFLRN